MAVSQVPFALTRCSITHTHWYHTRGGVPTHPSRSVCSIGTAHNRLSTSHHSEIHKSVQLLSIMQVAGRWKPSQMPAHYAKAELAERGAIARFKDGKPIKDLPNDKLRAKLSGVLWFRRKFGAWTEFEESLSLKA